MRRVNLKYSITKSMLCFNKGSYFLPIDLNNNQISPVVELLNDKFPNFIKVRVSNNILELLFLLRAIFHSDLQEFILGIVLSNKTRQKTEDALYLVSKIFGSEAILYKKRLCHNGSIYRFKIKRSLASTPKLEFGFYLISNGKNLKHIDNFLNNIYSQGVDDIEIGIVAPSSLFKNNLISKHPNVRIISDDHIYGEDIRFPISKKKNLILSQTSAKRIVILHERILFDSNWAQRILDNNPYFDFYTCSVTSDAGERFLDKRGVKFKGYIANKKQQFYLTHHEENSEQCLDGGLVVIHYRVAENHMFDERLHWGEMEDIELTCRAKLNCMTVTFDPENIAKSEFKQHFYLKSTSLLQVVYKVWLRRLPYIGHTVPYVIGYLRYILTYLRR
jgi:hypothetical protein